MKSLALLIREVPFVCVGVVPSNVQFLVVLGIIWFVNVYKNVAYVVILHVGENAKFVALSFDGRVRNRLIAGSKLKQ